MIPHVVRARLVVAKRRPHIEVGRYPAGDITLATGSHMSNDRNISALVQVLRGAPGLPAGIPLEALAQHLAAAGVLYPAALTDDQAVKLGADAVGSIPAEPTEIALCVREGLEKIARGDG
jgi:hypothetical protein